MMVEAWSLPEQLLGRVHLPYSRLLPAGPGGWQTLCQELLLRGAGGQQAAQGGAQDRPLLLGAVFVLLGNYRVLCVIFF